jgi:hypothetical protein
MNLATVRARTRTGEIVELHKECDCLDTIHRGPHWLHQDQLWQERNASLRGNGNDRGFVVEELARIREKIWEMESRGLEEVLDGDGTTGRDPT